MAQQDEQRNFRAQYYEKMGFRCVEEKRSLEPLLRESPVDGAKLAQFVRAHLVPGIYRPLVWRLLLKVQPCHAAVGEFVAARRRETYEDTVHHLRVLGEVTDATPAALGCWLGWLLNTGRLVRMTRPQIRRQKDAPQLQVAELVLDLFDCRVEQFFVCCRLWQLQRAALEQLPAQLPWLVQLLEREDPQLAAHLQQLGVLARGDATPLHNWIDTLFCGVLPGSSVERIVDKLVAGAERILPVTAVSLLVTHRRQLLAVEETSAARATLERLSEEDTDRVVSRALDLWARTYKV